MLKLNEWNKPFNYKNNAPFSFLGYQIDGMVALKILTKRKEGCLIFI